MGDKQLYTWDFTLKFQDERWEEIGKWLNGWAKKWAFQLETAINQETGEPYVHWQGRISLIKKKRKNELLSQLKREGWPFHWSPTSKEVHDGTSFNYVLKEDTRTDGPWKDSDYEEPPPFTWQLQYFFDNHKNNLDSYQQSILDYLKNGHEMRKIWCIIDEGGYSGKSLFAEYLEYEKLAYEMPPFTCSEDIMQCCMSITEQSAYLIDMPRAMKKDKLGQFYSGIESLKDGKAYDKRYCFKKRRMNRPKIIVFTNTLPDLSMLTGDRWCLWKIDRKKQLTPWIQEDEDAVAE